MTLIEQARALYRAGFTVVPSRGKEPIKGLRWRWADGSRSRELSREELATAGAGALRLSQSAPGSPMAATSVSVRLDGDLIALDLDSYDAEFTMLFAAMMHHFYPAADGMMYTVTGRKGLKIFARLPGKRGLERVQDKQRQCMLDYLLQHYSTEHGEIALEIKHDISACAGRHSEGIEYRAYEMKGCRALWECPSPEVLPVVQLETVYWIYTGILYRLRGLCPELHEECFRLFRKARGRMNA